MIILCAGMFRSGSTWQYQVALELASRLGQPVTAHGCLHPGVLAQFVSSPESQRETHVIKIHDVDDSLTCLTRRDDLRVLYSYRDIRDVVFSLMHKTASSFEQVVQDERYIERCLAADAFWSGLPADVVQRYERWLDDPIPDIVLLGAAIGIALTEDERVGLIERYGMSAQKARVEAIARQFQDQGVDISKPEHATLFDPESLLHWNHIRNGDIGGWRTLATPEQREVLRDKCGEWLIARGYEADHAWANSR